VEKKEKEEKIERGKSGRVSPITIPIPPQMTHPESSGCIGLLGYAT
jgi:hypothetical protein